MKETYNINNDTDRKQVLEAISALLLDDNSTTKVIVSKTRKNRTESQNRSFRLYLSNLATALNDAGYCFNDRKVIRLDTAFTGENLKKDMWDKVQVAMFPSIKSSADLSTIQLCEVYESLNQTTANLFGISIPFPDRFSR